MHIVRTYGKQIDVLHIDFESTKLLFVRSSIQQNHTCYSFKQNDTSVEEKQHVVFPKTTRHFPQNNTSVEEKQAQGIIFDRKMKLRLLW